MNTAQTLLIPFEENLFTSQNFSNENDTEQKNLFFTKSNQLEIVNCFAVD